MAAAEDEPVKSGREIVAAFEYPRMQMDVTESRSLDLIIKNNGGRDETVLLEIAQSPPECLSSIEQYGDVIGGVFVASGDKKTLKLAVTKKVERIVESA